MKQNFWQKLKAERFSGAYAGDPILVLAPMANVTDMAFRRIIAKYGKPDVIWTEFVSADGLALASAEGRAKLMKDLEYSEAERPIVAQFFSARPEMMEKAAKLAVKLGFDGIDINMGCPDKSIEKQGAGAAHIKNPKLAQEVIRAAMRGAMKKDGSSLPVSVKTRIGYSKDELSTWLPALLETRPAVITIHARTRKEMSKVPARWAHIKEAVKMRDDIQRDLPSAERTLIFGNGDVLDLEDAVKKAGETGADGVMLGRAIFGNPWLFSDEARKQNRKWADIPLKEKLTVLLEHTKLFEKLLGDTKNFAIMKKHFKAYVNGFDGAAELRAELMNTENAAQVSKIIRAHL